MCEGTCAASAAFAQLEVSAKGHMTAFLAGLRHLPIFDLDSGVLAYSAAFPFAFLLCGSFCPLIWLFRMLLLLRHH